MILGISGKKQSGKDLVGKIIQWLVSNNTISFDDWINISTSTRNSYSHWIIKSFADNLKDIVCLIINCTRDELEDESFKNKELGEEWDIPYTPLDSTGIRYNKLTPRMILQQLGTEVGRNIHPNIWINSLMKDYISDKHKLPNWIITDTRFKNEVEAIEDKGGFIIRVNRSIVNNSDYKDYVKYLNTYPSSQGYITLSYVDWKTGGNHQSEIELDNHSFKYTIDNNGTIIELISKVKEILIKEKLIK